MKFKTLLIGFILSLFSMTAMAGSGHDHGHSHASIPVNQTTATENAEKVIASLVERNKIDQSWIAIKSSSVEKKVINNTPEWVIVFVNDKITDIEKQKLYVFLTPGGEYIAVNYTGK
ncbi:MAG: hypothetical protein KAI22_11165 [Gammaproteobacteria bacterium]|nr:hypothetical protein [Gammaproteobacteria bacterium]